MAFTIHGYENFQDRGPVFPVKSRSSIFPLYNLPKAGLFVQCGCPADSVKQLFNRGLIVPGHPRNDGTRPLLIGLQEQRQAQSGYIMHGSYGVPSVEELVESGCEPELARAIMRMKLRFAFGRMRDTSELPDLRVAGSEATELRNGAFVRRKGFNLYEFTCGASSLTVDLSLQSGESFDRYFDVADLSLDVWNDVEGLEVRPVLSAHPVETTVLFFRACGADGPVIYAHLADIPTFDILRKMVTEDGVAPGVERAYQERLERELLTRADLKKIDAGGGCIHGSAMDFRSDPSPRILISHVAGPLSDQQKQVGSSASFGRGSSKSSIFPAAFAVRNEFLGRTGLGGEARRVAEIGMGSVFGGDEVLKKGEAQRVRAIDDAELLSIPGKALLGIPIVQWKLFETLKKRMMSSVRR
jgi:hypothetical protein